MSMGIMLLARSKERSSMKIEVTFSQLVDMSLALESYIVFSDISEAYKEDLEKLLHYINSEIYLEEKKGESNE